MPSAGTITGSPRKGAAVGRKRQAQPKDVRRKPAGRFGAHLEQLATAAGFNPQTFAAAIGKSEDSVWAYFRGTRTPHIDDWPKIAKALGLKSVRELLPPGL